MSLDGRADWNDDLPIHRNVLCHAPRKRITGLVGNGRKNCSSFIFTAVPIGNAGIGATLTVMFTLPVAWFAGCVSCCATAVNDSITAATLIASRFAIIPPAT